MSSAPTGLPLREASHQESDNLRFSNLRGVRWRVDLGILPSSPPASIEELRRVAADCRRRYASLRRHLLIDLHLPKDGNRSPDLTMDNPLSQNPDSTWGRFFRNAELEKLVDNDLSRLYPEHENYFQSPACQAMLRRILLVWCLRHPEYGYRQGMHELLAPLLYVLHVDLKYLSQVRALYEDCFNDEFDEMNFPEGDLVSNYRFTKSSSWDSRSDSDNFPEDYPKVTSLDDLDPETKELFLLSDVYGAEGELGVILSERFMEHDAYCMFDGLMSGARGVVAMADFFTPTPMVGSSTGLPPVIEASAALYHLLSIVDSSLHSHLVELGVEPQYFALRWLRVLFGREFSLDDLLLIWDTLFSSSNISSVENEHECNFKILCSPRGAFISAVAVSMLLHLRSSLLATEIATSCLQRLLNFPKKVDVKKLIEKAKAWQSLALEANVMSPPENSSKREVSRARSIPTDACSPKTPNQSLPDSYWEEKWRVLHEEISSPKNGSHPVSHGKIKKLLGDRFGLARTGSYPSATKRDSRSSTVRRRLLDDFTDANNNPKPNGVPELAKENEPRPLDVDREKSLPDEPTDQSVAGRLSDCTTEETCLSGENSSVFSTANSPHIMENDPDNDSEKSSLTSNSSVADNDEDTNQVEDNQDVESTCSTNATAACTSEIVPVKDGEVKQGAGLKDRKPLSGKLQWFLRFGRSSGEPNSEKGALNVENVCNQSNGTSTSECKSSGDTARIEVGDKKVMGTLKNLGQSMIENIQVIESVFQQDRGQTGNILGSKGQAKAMAALKELRKISNILSEM
ncbi:uncharacterized protein A4U43_C05F23820 [Asparagus officinalis]|uniref:Rab-GAP TBC domain-containing protein n=1 Tax=Asparagus officinalis TaxID=4686 RepID=A0A5P1ETZ5_ASPOF|nr:TBC1 domain family member 5 homolog B-like [Asparagus officinalis]ONK69518.1 uncharacterized protein A4U43_C05F23820 [Asparagus officinalis]